MARLPGDEPEQPARPRPEPPLASWYRMTSVGFEFIIAVVLFGAVGWFLDRWLDTRPWLLLVGCGLGFAVGLWAMIRTGMKSFRQ